MSEEILEAVREFVRKEFGKPGACYKDSFGNHFKIVVRYGLTLAKLERSYNKLSDDVRPLVFEKLDKARGELG